MDENKKYIIAFNKPLNDIINVTKDSSFNDNNGPISTKALSSDDNIGL